MNRIRAIIMDVDGTLTDGKLHISDDNEVFKSFYCRDGLGILQAKKYGIEPVILTSRKSRIVEQRAKELNIQYVYQGYKDNKIVGMYEIIRKLELERREIAYIGDDINDIECMKISGYVGCPSDSVKEVKEIADYCCEKKGGEGAVREFIDLIIAQLDYDDI